MKPWFLLALSFFISSLSLRAQEDCTCDSLWQIKVTSDFVSLLESSTSETKAFWGDYYLGKGVVVLEAGKNREEHYCLGAWKEGKNMGYACLSDKPKMLTPLYTYYLKMVSVDTSNHFNQLLKTKDDSPAFNAWMEQLKITSAVYMPTDFPDFPFTISALKKVQLAVHESFHTEVQIPKWIGGKGYWPDWDKQPDRPGIQACCTHTTTVDSLIKTELANLADLIESLMDDDHVRACKKGEEFLKNRAGRMDLLKTVQVERHDETMGSCAEAEAIMEWEEGLADWASWTQLYNVGIVSKEQLLQRYRAQQKDHFYLSGNMLMHATDLMSTASTKDRINEMVQSGSVEEGSLLTFFKRALEQYCH